MTTTLKPLPPHGTIKRAWTTPRCRCNPCREAERRYTKWTKLLKASGRALTIDPAPVSIHLRNLREQDCDMRMVARITQCSPSTIHELLAGRQKSIRRTTATRILAVQPEQALNPARQIPAIGSIRRLRALTAIAHPAGHLAAETVMSNGMLWQLITGRATTLRADMAERIADAYPRLVMNPGTSERSRKRATEQGWHGPLAWGDDIDDPNAIPDTDDAPDPALSRDELAALRRMEIEHLAAFNLPEDEIAQRLGMARKTVHEIHVELRTGARRDRKKQELAA